MWLDDYRVFFTYREVASVEDNLLPSTSLTVSNYPNPFNPETTMTFILPDDVNNLDLIIYNICGQHVRTLINGIPQSGGEYYRSVGWQG